MLVLLSFVGCSSSAPPVSETPRARNAQIGPAMNDDTSDSAANPDSEPIVLSVAAASSLKFALDAVAAKYQQRRPNCQIALMYGSSGNLYAQAMQKAPFDLYLSADVDYPSKLAEQGVAAEDGMFIYATGRLVVWSRNDSPFDPNAMGLDVLKEPAVQKVAIANPKLAPYGAAAMSVLEKAGLLETVKDKLALGDTIAQTAQFVDSGGADIGMIALSLAVSPGLRDRGKGLLVPGDLHAPIRHGGVILAGSPHQEAAAAFRDFLRGSEGRLMLAEYGFETPDP